MKKFLTNLLSAMITLIAANAQEETPKQYTVDGFTFEKRINNNGIEYATLIDDTQAIEIAIQHKTYTITVPECIIDENGNKINVEQINPGVICSTNEIKKIILPDGIKAIYHGNLNKCPNLEEVYLGKSLIFLAQFTLFDLPKLKSISFPNTLNELGDGVLCQCNELEYIQFPESLYKIGMSSVLCLPKVKELDFKTKNVKIDVGSVRVLPSIKRIVLPRYSAPIYDSSFCALNSLEEIVLPEGAGIQQDFDPWIYSSAFAFCPSLTRIFCPNIIPPRMTDALGTIHVFGAGDLDGNGAIDRQKCTLYVPKGSLQAYRDDPSWGSFPNIEEYEPASVEQIFEDNNADVMPGVIQTRNGEIILRDFGNANISIFSADARLHYNGNVTDTEISLPSGIYIVACGNARMKVSL